jgi:hypothetical protein
MLTAAFDHINPGDDSKLPTCEAEVTAFIVSRTQMYRDTYLCQAIRELIQEELEKKLFAKIRIKTRGQHVDHIRRLIDGARKQAHDAAWCDEVADGKD